MESTNFAVHTEFTFAWWTYPGGVWIITVVLKLFSIQIGTVKMEPKRAMFTTYTFIIFSRETLITVFTIFIFTGVTSPWFIGVVLMSFYFKFSEFRTVPVVTFFTFWARDKIITDHTGTDLTF